MSNSVSINTASRNLFIAFGAIVVFSIFGAILLNEVLLLGLPALALLVFQTVMDYRRIYLLLFACVPISIEFYFSSSLATDLPTEPLILGLMLVYLLVVLVRPQSLDGRFWTHPLSLILILHFAWILVAALASASIGISIKFLLAKFWYIITFYFLTGHIMKSERQIEQLLWLIFIPLSLATLKVIAHHYILDFGFQEINTATTPFFRNHVAYAAILALIIPLVWFVRKWYPRWSLPWLACWVMLGIFLFGVGYAYTRAAYLALAMAAGAYWVIRFRMVRWVLLVATLGIVGLFAYFVQDNRFMDFTPTERTIAHEDFEDIVSATYKLEDVSTMERYYRWIGGIRLANEDLYTGHGPGNFHTFYKGYTLNKFSTYVSDNPERSGIHNYYLMVLVEQGLPGLIIFLLLNFYALILGERVYHESKSRKQKDIVMSLLLVLVVIDAFLLINDMIETDKTGSFFFFGMAVLVMFDLKNQKESAKNKAISSSSKSSDKPIDS